LPDVVVSEVHFSPLDPDGPRGIRPDDLEFIEIYNRSDAAVDLGNWQLTGGVSFEFAEGEMLSPGEAVPVVGFRITTASRLAAFRTLNSLDVNSRLLGDYDGALEDTAGQITLLERDPVSGGESATVWVVADEVAYGSETPWPIGTDGLGNSLHRIRPTEPGQLPGSWRADTPSPNSVDFVDRIAGDANGDDVFDQLDIVAILQAAKYLTGESATFADGDFNGDHRFDSLDIVMALQEGRYLQREGQD
jgi:hypothetical protein